MKELSIKEKARRYDEALERAKEWYSDAQIGIGFKANLKKLFPELAESDDERIRKEIISMFETLDRKDWIAWLEKRGEQKDILEDATIDNNEDGLIADTIKAKGKQKPLSEEDIATISRVISIVKWAAYSNHSHPILNNESATELVERLKSLKDRYAFKPSDEQMKALCFVKKAKILDPEERESLNSLYIHLKELKKLRDE